MTASAAHVRWSHSPLPKTEPIQFLSCALATPKPCSLNRNFHIGRPVDTLKGKDGPITIQAHDPFHKSIKRHSSSDSSSSARRRIPSFSGRKRHTLDNYYNYLLKRPLAAQAPMTKTLPEPSPPESLPETDREAHLAKARVVFGSRLAGPTERRRELSKDSQEIAGIVVPPRPDEPDNCCMSGCVNCVWDRYREELEEWAEKAGEARMKMQDGKSVIPRGLKPLLGDEQSGKSKKDKAGGGMAATSMDDDGGGSETNWDITKSMGGGAPGAPTSFTSPDLFQDIPIGIREFMRTEKRLKEKRKEAPG